MFIIMKDFNHASNLERIAMADKEPTYEKIVAIENMIEAQIVESILLERRIPFRIKSFHDTAYDGLFQFQKGWGELYAPTEQKEEILEIVTGIRAGDSGNAPLS